MDQADDVKDGGLPSGDDGRSGSHSPQHPTLNFIQHVHRPNNNIGVQHSNTTIQQQNHHRSHSLDSPTSRPNMDPTGMFRNRGRRSIKRSAVVSSPSPSRMIGPSNSYRPPPISPTNNSNNNTSHNQNNNQQQDRYRTLYDSPQLPQQSLVSNVSQNDMIATQQQSIPSSTTANNDNNNQYPLQTSIDNNTPYAKLTDKYQSVEATPLHTLQVNNHDNSQDSNTDSNGDNDYTGDDQEAHSTIGSTVSVMGSIVDEDDDNNNNTNYDNAKQLLEVKIRMMRDVQEVVEEEEENDDEIDNEETDINMDNLQNESNVVRVADFSQQSGSVDNTTTSTDQKNIFNDSNNNTSYESPFRESLKRLTPNRAISSSAIIDKAANTASILPQLARQCFSFEDTTVDDDNFLIMRDQLHMKIEGGEMGRSRRQLDTHKYYGLSAVASLSDDDDDDSPVSSMRNTTTAARDNILQRNAPKWFPPQRTRLFNEESTGTPFRVIRHTQTWDNNNIDERSSKRIQHLGGNSLRQTSSFDPWSPQRVNRVGRVVQPLGNKIESYPNNSVGGVDGTKDWKRIETERRKAIDYLTSMVKQSLSFDQTEIDDYSMEKATHIANSLKDSKSLSDDNDEPIDHQTRSNVIDMLLRSHDYVMKAKESSLSANEWLKSINSSKDECMNRDDDLISRLQTAESNILSKQQEISRLKMEIGRLESTARSESQQNTISTSKPTILSNSSSLSMDNSLELCSPRQHVVKPCESQDDSFVRWEQDIEKQMNLESRKEVLMLRAALETANRQIAVLEKKKEPFSSDIEPINASMGNSNSNTTEDICMQIAEDIENEASDSTTSNDEEDDEIEEGSRVMLHDPVLEKELEEYRQALLATTVDESRRDCSRADSITSSDDLAVQDVSIKSNSSDKMINVKMLDGENFITSWNNVDLPSPPDHDLYSPIVDTILEAWSEDPGTRSALVDWIENVLKGSNTDSMPSLKLSGLDHTTRDGFVMHILPLLLRRKDIHVHLTSRAHRHTSYDVAVKVTLSFSQNNDRVSASKDVETLQQGLISHTQENKHLYAYQATKSGATSIVNESQLDGITSPYNTFNQPFLKNIVRSASNAGSITASAVTSPISNRTPSRIPSMYGRARYTSLSSEMKQIDDTSFTQDLSGVGSPSLGDDLSAASSGDEAEEDESADDVTADSQRRLLGSISGALGGMLSRRKPTETASQSPMPQMPKRGTVAQGEGFHRVVSAPPGKINITFVEYRGHTLISHVSEDSPLSGWVFVNDVLVAIDDVPVSGLRTRDIAKLLTDRVDQQRNLRVVSAVALKELNRP